jgi:GR25 family glycosyltransferase involved in LPS biosynthesis
MTLDNIYYINLDERTDRKEKIEKEFAKMGWKYTRMSAIKTQHGIVGCGMSHLKLIKMAKDKNLDYICVFEDDAYFTNPSKLKELIEYAFSKNLEYDVLLLAGNVKEDYRIDEYVYKTTAVFCGTAYVVRKHYYDKLINNISEGLKILVKDPNKREYSWDAYWINLQKTDNWLILKPRTVTQRPDHSDIEDKFVNYSSLMLD